jgi:DMSO reductase anchor subunit
MAESYRQQLPLALFTTLLPIGIGIEIGAGLAGKTGNLEPPTLLRVLILSFACTFLSAILVLFHLGRKGRSAKALKGIDHSPLSREIILAASFGVLLAADIVILHLQGATSLFYILTGLTGFIGAAAALSIGMVCNLAAQSSWQGILNTMGPLTGVCLVALSLIAGIHRDQQPPVALMISLLAILIIETLIFTRRIVVYRCIAKNDPHQLTFPHYRFFILGCSAIKGIIFLATVFLIISQKLEPIVYLAALTYLVDRLAFYASAAKQTPRATMDRLKEERMQAALEAHRK